MSIIPQTDVPRGRIEDLFEGVCIVDQRLTLLRWNHPAEAITGYSEAELVGERCRDDLLLALDPVRGSVSSLTSLLAETLRDMRHREIEAYLRHKHGHLIPAKVRLTPFQDAAGRTQVVAFILTRNLGGEEVARRGPDHGGEVMLDPLTGAARRKLIEMHLRFGLSEMYRHGWTFGVVLLAVRGLPDLAARQGPDLAAQVILAVARTLANRTDPQDVLGRWRDDAFLAMCRNIGRQQLDELAATLRALSLAATGPFSRDGVKLGIAASAVMATPGHTFDSLIRRVEDLVAHDGRAST